MVLLVSPSKTVHVFTNSGDFNNTSGGNLSVEYLVIGGGGGGGSRFGGGGGAGAYRTATGFTVSPGPNTVTVGAGGAGGVTKMDLALREQVKDLVEVTLFFRP